MKRKFYILLLSLSVSISALAQQDPMYSEYMFNGLILNPAYAGTRDALNATLLYRNQWVSLPGAPKTGLFSLDAPVRNQKVGLGLSVEFDRIGITDHTGVSGAYSYKLKFDKGALTLGIQAGVGFSSSNYTRVNYTDGTRNDEAFQQDFREVLPNFGFGAYYYTDKFYAGFSIPQIAGQTLQKAIYGNQEGAHLDLANHYFLTSGYLVNLTPDFRLKPSVLLKYVAGAPVEIDVNTVAYFYDILGLGVSYRSLASINFLGHLKVTNQIYIGYAYEYSTGKLGSFSGGSHEIMLQYTFDFARTKIVTPRFF